MRSFLPSAPTFRAFTLVELLIALALSLILLIGMTELFSRVSGIMNDTRATLNLTENLDAVERLLRADFAWIPDSLPTKPARIADPDIIFVSDSDGYLEITEGPDAIDQHPYRNEDGLPDQTVGDVDDIIGFTAVADSAIPFRGLLIGANGELEIAERSTAEIVWFVRGNTLYRRMRLIDDQAVVTNPDDDSTMEQRARRDRRFGHDGVPTGTTNALNSFPYPLYDAVNNGWQYMRMPTLEETLPTLPGATRPKEWDTENWRLLIGTPTITNPDLWNQPHFFPNVQDRKSGSLKEYVAEPRHHRAGEDVILTNVLSFDVKIWDPDTKNFVDLGTVNTKWSDTNSTKWEYRTNPADADPTHTRTLPRVWDSWTRSYGAAGEDSSRYGDFNVYTTEGKVIVMPPYRTPLSAIQITIRCFDPQSKGIKQISVVHKF